MNKNLIAQRKAEYGNSFVELANIWNKYEITEPRTIALMLADLKQTRINNIKIRLAVTTVGTDRYFNLIKALEDSATDRDNYLWIANNFEEYLTL